MKPPRLRRNRPTPGTSAPLLHRGQRIRAVRGFALHSYEPGRVYTVVATDPNDQTLRAVDATGTEGTWIKWSDCVKANEIGWDWLMTALPAEALDLLAAFDGLENLSLRDDIRNRLVMRIPNLMDQILDAHMEEEAENSGAGSAGQDVALQDETADSLLSHADLD